MKCVIPLFSIKNIVYTLPGTQYNMKYTHCRKNIFPRGGKKLKCRLLHKIFKSTFIKLKFK